MLIKKHLFHILFFVLFPVFGYCFNLSVTPTSETCSGNGSLNFTVSNTNSGSTIVYLIYKLPNTTVPIASLNTNFIGGLVAGDYRVIAKETFNNTETSQQQDVTVVNAIVSLNFTVESLNQACSTTSTLSVLVTSGVAATYEILSGPATFPVQTSNIFTNLPAGTYVIRVIDSCGIGSVTTYKVILNPTGLTLSNPVYSDTNPSSCTETIATQTITPAAGTVIGYPLTVSYTIHPPGGAPDIVINSTIASGNPSSQDIATTFPSYINQTYPFDVSITDVCNTTLSHSFISNQNLNLAANVNNLPCNKYSVTVTPSNFTPPYTLQFSNSPAGFDPILFNTTFPGSFTTPSVDFGDINNPLPFGNYTISCVDACGKTGIATFKVIDLPPAPIAKFYSNGCLTHTADIVIRIPNYKIVTAIIISAPATYLPPLPQDVSSFINAAGILTVPNVPLGDYIFQLTDDCNDIIPPVHITVLDYVDKGLSTEIRLGCDLGKGSFKVLSLNNKITSISITPDPTASGTTAYNGMPNVTANGIFLMNNIAAGTYAVSVTDSCLFTNTVNVVIDGYAITSSNYTMQPNCGSFDLALNFVSNGNTNETFWLQKQLNSTTDTWGWTEAQFTNTYINGTIPDSNNSKALLNSGTTFNLQYNGTFRIFRHFLSFNNGSEINNGTVTGEDKNCFEILTPTFNFNQALEITDAYRVPCGATSSLDVFISATGTAPLHYEITTKNNVPFALDNLTSNVFTNLSPAIYTFLVHDSCGNFVTRIFDLTALISLININKPDDILQCKSSISNNELFDISIQNQIILGPQSPTEYTLTYYTSLNDAQLNTNSIANLTTFNPTSNPQTIYARLVFNQLALCYEITDFKLIVGQTPKLLLNANYLHCTNESPLVLNAAVGNVNNTTYLWNNGSTNPSQTISNPGINNLSITATNTYGIKLNGVPFECHNTKDITVIVSEAPHINHVETIDWTVNQNELTVFTSNTGVFEYSIDGSTYQDSPTFSNLTEGLYTVYVRDISRCGLDSKVVCLLDYPRFFTPNDDGANDFWFIKNSYFEPELSVIIYDRYGKIMTGFKSNSTGWDGNYNGNKMFATDYWFVVTRQDGRVHKGHFSLVR